MYNSHDDVPTSVADFVLTASGKSNIKEVPMKDINGFVEMMKGVDNGTEKVNNKRTWRNSYWYP